MNEPTINEFIEKVYGSPLPKSKNELTELILYSSFALKGESII